MNRLVTTFGCQAKRSSLDLFKWADSRPTAKIYDWNVTFAERVMSRIHEYDDMWPKPHYDNEVSFIGKADVRRVCR